MRISRSYHFIVVFLIIMSYLTPTEAKKPDNFPQAKRMAKRIFKQKPSTLYCACDFNDKEVIDLKSCGMESAGDIKRANKMEWEHIMPSYQIGKEFPCWTQKLCTDRHGKPYSGRACCEAIEPEFNQRESELYNLWPAVGLVNQVRSSFGFSKIKEKQSFYGCSLTFDRLLRKVEPRNEVKGIVARANLFMLDHYGIAMTETEKQLFLEWHKKYPPKEWEKQWAKEVAEVEGYENPYIH